METMTMWESSNMGAPLRALPANYVFVFGSNPEGRHGAGAALAAKKYFGAKYGVGHGAQGQSYALVTKNLKANFMCPHTRKHYPLSGVKSVSLEEIHSNVAELYEYAKQHPHKKFIVPYLNGSTTLCGYTPQELVGTCFLTGHWPPDNVLLHISWADVMNPRIVQCHMELLFNE